MADAKISALTENTTLNANDLLPLVDDPAGTPATQKTKLQTLADWLAALSQTLTNKTLTGPVWDGWSTTSDTWVYASATTFTIAGVDRTAILTKGTKIKLTQTTAKYFYVVSSAFSTNTTVTVTGGTDYTLADAAITSPNYSYASNPQGFPHWFNYLPTITAPGGTAPTYTAVDVGKFKLEGNQVTFQFYKYNTSGGQAGAGAVPIYASLPVTALLTKTAGETVFGGLAGHYNNTTYGVDVGMVYDATTMAFKASTSSYLTAAGQDNVTRVLWATINYEI